MYTLRLLRLTGSQCAEFELPPGASVADVLLQARRQGCGDGTSRLQVVLGGRPLEAEEKLESLGLPAPPSPVELQLLSRARLVQRIGAQTSGYQKIDIGICGQRLAGKTIFVHQYAGHEYSEHYELTLYPSPICVNLLVDRQEQAVPVKLTLWDLHGSHVHQSAAWDSRWDFSGKAAIIFMADLERLALHEIQQLLDRSAAFHIQERVLLGNKMDARTAGNSEAAETFAASRGLTYLETSARDHASVELVMQRILVTLLDKLELKLSDPPRMLQKTPSYYCILQ